MLGETSYWRLNTFIKWLKFHRIEHVILNENVYLTKHSLRVSFHKGNMKCYVRDCGVVGFMPVRKLKKKILRGE